MRTFSEIAKDLINIKGFKTQAELARYFGVKPNTITTWKARNMIPFELIIALCDRDHIDAIRLLTGEVASYVEPKPRWKGEVVTAKSQRDQIKPPLGEDEYSGKKEEKKEGPLYNKIKEKGYTLVPQYDVQVSTGGGACVHSEQIVDHLAFKTAWIKKDMNLDPEKLSLITVIGDSMEPTIREGDLLLIDLRQIQVTDDAIYVLSLDGRLLAKRLQRAVDGTIFIRSDNPVYKELTVSKDNTENLHVIGRVIWIGRRV